MKYYKKVIIVALVIVISLLLFACGNTQDTLTEGQWKYTKEYLYELSKNTSGDFDTLQQVFGNSVLVFNQDGTYVIDFDVDENDTDDLNEEGTYVINNNTVIMSPKDDEEREYRLDKDRLLEGSYTVYEKIK